MDLYCNVAEARGGGVGGGGGGVGGSGGGSCGGGGGSGGSQPQQAAPRRPPNPRGGHQTNPEYLEFDSTSGQEDQRLHNDERKHRHKYGPYESQFCRSFIWSTADSHV